MEDARNSALFLASREADAESNLETISEAYSMVEDQSLRNLLANGVGLEAANACSTDGGYERVQFLLLNALFFEAQPEAAIGESEPTPNMNSLSKVICHLILKAHTQQQAVSVDLIQTSTIFFKESLEEDGTLGMIVVESFLHVARLPIKAENHGLYIPALILARSIRSIIAPPSLGSKRRHSNDTAFRRDVMDLFGRRVFALGGYVKPATATHVYLARTIIHDLAKDEFDGSMLRPLKFKLITAPEPIMATIAAFLDVLTEVGHGNYVDSHLNEGANLVACTLKQVSSVSSQTGRSVGATVMAALAKASPEKGAIAVTEAMANALGDVDGVALEGLCAGLERVANCLLEMKENGLAMGVWKDLADSVSIPALCELEECTASSSALSSWLQLSGREEEAAVADATSATSVASSKSKSFSSSRSSADVSTNRRASGELTEMIAKLGIQNVDSDAISRSDDKTTAEVETFRFFGVVSSSEDTPTSAVVVQSNNNNASDDAATKKNAREDTPTNAVVVPSNNNNASDDAATKKNARETSSTNDAMIEQADAAVKNRMRGSSHVPAVKPGVDHLPPDEVLDSRINAKFSGRDNEIAGSNSNNHLITSGAAGVTTLGRLQEVTIDSNDNYTSHDKCEDDDDQKDAFLDQQPLVNSRNNSFSLRGRGTASHLGPPYDDENPHDSQGMGGGPNYIYGTDGGDGNGLAVAVAVSPDEDEAFLPAAVQYDPDAKPPLYKNRRFCLYSVFAVVVVFAIALGVSVGITKNTAQSTELHTDILRTEAPTQTPTARPTTSNEQSLFQFLSKTSVGKETELKDKSTPWGKTYQWLLDQGITNTNLIGAAADETDLQQRYIIGLLYYSTSNGYGWNYCGKEGDVQIPSNETVNECYSYNLLTGEVKSGGRWMGKTHECDWLGISCPKGTFVVSEINLWQYGLNGTFPTELGMLPQLRVLSAVANNVEGFLPSELGKLKNLEDIEINSNFLSGKIPKEIFNLPSLLRLNIGQNFFTGTLSPKLGQLKYMMGLFTFQNLFTGEFPSEFGLLQRLSYTRFSDNEHVGTLPAEIGDIKTLKELWVQRNRFEGDLPPNIGNNAGLETFYINQNNFTGTLPESFYNLTRLQQFYGHTNQMTGTISTDISKMTSLSQLIIKDNAFKGTLPSEIGLLSNLQYLWVHYNDFSGTIASSICKERTGNLSSFSADCDIQNGPPDVECSCCTDCCNDAQQFCLKLVSDAGS